MCQNCTFKFRKYKARKNTIVFIWPSIDHYGIIYKYLLFFQVLPQIWMIVILFTLQSKIFEKEVCSGKVNTLQGRTPQPAYNKAAGKYIAFPFLILENKDNFFLWNEKFKKNCFYLVSMCPVFITNFFNYIIFVPLYNELWICTSWPASAQLRHMNGYCKY